MWQRLKFDDRPYEDAPSFEWNTDWRDYEMKAWRNTRRNLAGSTWRESVTNLVVDSVATTRRPGTTQFIPLSIAYVDERRELFAFAPERLLLAAQRAPDLKALSDTIIGGVAHARTAATIDHFPSVIFTRRGDEMLAMVRFRANEENDFGLAPLGEMEVEFWYSNWRTNPQLGVHYPMQLDVRRAGRPYKRMTITSATFDSPALPDSFTVADSVREAYFRTSTNPMHDRPLDSIRVFDERFAAFYAFGYPAGAVKLGSKWVVLEAGQAPLVAQRATDALRAKDASGTIFGSVVTVPSVGSGGAAWFAKNGHSIVTGTGVRPFMDATLKGYGVSGKGLTAVSRGQWIKVDRDSMWVESMDIPDLPGSAVVYVPSLEWVYTNASFLPIVRERVLALAQKRGWKVSRIGSARDVAAKVQ